MAAGGYFAHVCEIIVNLKDMNTLTAAGFQLPQMQPGFTVAELTEVVGEDIETLAIEEDEYAHTYGQCTMHMVCARMNRGLHYFSWPGLMSSSVKSEDHAKRVVPMFRVDEACIPIFKVSCSCVCFRNRWELWFPECELTGADWF